MNLKKLAAQRFALGLCVMLSACAAANPSAADAEYPAGKAYGAFLAGQYANAILDPGTAAKFYETALQAAPGNPMLINDGFISALLAGSPLAADLARQKPGNPLATMLLGNEAAAQGRFKAAETLYSQLPDDSLSGLLKPLLIGWTQAGAGDPTAALDTLVPAAQNSPFGGIYILNAALVADNADDMKDAVQLYQTAEAINQAPNLRLAQILASWKARQGETAAADAELQQMAASHPSLGLALPALEKNIAKPVIANPTDGLAEAYLAIAGALDQPSQVPLRITFLRFALALRPDLSAARLLLANVLSGAEQPPSVPLQPSQIREAIKTLEPIPPDDPLWGPAVLQQADLMAALDEPDQAVALLDKLIAAMPGSVDALQEAGDILRANNEFKRAIFYYDRAIAALPKPTPEAGWALYYDRAICEDQSGDWAAAEPDLQTALSLSPNQPYVLNYLGYSWALHGRHMAQAEKMLQQAVGLDPNEGAIIDSLGYVTLRQGHTRKALKLLIQAVELDPDDAEVNAHLGDAFWAAGQRLQAGYQWQRALGLQPDPKLQAELQDKLKQLQPPA